MDLVAVDGLSTSLVQTILSEIGTDMSKWSTVKQFASWLGLAPHNDISGGKVSHSRTLPTNNRAGQAFRHVATTMARSPSALGAYYRRKRAQVGPQFAQVATAHKIARTVYYLLKHHVQYPDLGAANDEHKQREREVIASRKKATKLGFSLTYRKPSLSPDPNLYWLLRNLLRPEPHVANVHSPIFKRARHGAVRHHKGMKMR